MIIVFDLSKFQKQASCFYCIKQAKNIMFSVGKKGTSMILCFYRQKDENFKEKHKIIDVPILSRPHLFLLLNVPLYVGSRTGF
jgi:hypothetical protein